VRPTPYGPASGAVKAWLTTELFYCVVSHYQPRSIRGWNGTASPKWPILCRVGRLNHGHLNTIVLVTEELCSEDRIFRVKPQFDRLFTASSRRAISSSALLWSPSLASQLNCQFSSQGRELPITAPPAHQHIKFNISFLADRCHDSAYATGLSVCLSVTLMHCG